MTPHKGNQNTAIECLLRYLVPGWYGKLEIEVRDGKVQAITPHGPRVELGNVAAT